MRLLFPGRHPGLISRIEILLVSWLAGVAGGLVVGRGGVVASRVGVPHHHLTAPHPLHTRVGLALGHLQLLDLFLLLFLLLRLSVSNKSHGGLSGITELQTVCL